MTATIFGAADRAYALEPTTTQTANVTAAANQLVPCNTTLGSFTVTLPPAPADLSVVAVKLLAGTSALTIATSAGDVFDAPVGSTTQTLTIPGQGVVFQYSASLGIWFVTSDPLPLTDLDGRYVLQTAGVTQWFNVKAGAYGATGNGTTDDSVAINAAFAAAEATGGVAYIPPGRYLCNNLVGGSNVRIRGDGDNASILLRNGNGTLLSLSGPSSDPTGATHVRHSSMAGVQLNGNGGTGQLLQAYYADNLNFTECNFSNNNDLGVAGVELWDSKFLNCTFVSMTGTAGSTTQPAVWLRNSAAASGFGSSTDTVNEVSFISCRFEACGTGALWITQGTGSSTNPNKCFITDCKIECDQIQGGPALWLDNSTKGIFVSGLTVNIGGFASGWSTPEIAISFGGGNNALRDTYITNNGVATISDGVFLHAVGGSILVVDNVQGNYGTAPTSGHLFYDSSATGSYFTQAIETNVGTLQAGSVPTKFVGGAGDVQTFTTAGAGAWTKPPGAVKTTILLIGGGGGGGSGAVEASGTLATGGGGGAGGAYTVLEVPSALLSATESIQVGAGGTGGTAVGTTAANGNTGGNGTNSWFRGGQFAIANWGNGGAGGTATGAAAGGSGGGGVFNGGSGASSSATGAAGSGASGTSQGAPGGGSGGGITTGAAASAGGAGAVVSSSGGNAAGTAGTTAGGAGGAGTSVTAGTPIPGTGGGGGGSSTTGNGGTGGAGGLYGAGGGGGGAALSGHSSGAGGNGGGGLVVVITT